MVSKIMNKCQKSKIAVKKKRKTCKKHKKTGNNKIEI